MVVDVCVCLWSTRSQTSTYDESDTNVPTVNWNLSNRSFWRLVRALHEYVDEHGQLPVRRVLPDMSSDSKRYLRLLGIYREASATAVDWMIARLKQVRGDVAYLLV